MIHWPRAPKWCRMGPPSKQMWYIYYIFIGGAFETYYLKVIVFWGGCILLQCLVHELSHFQLLPAKLVFGYLDRGSYRQKLYWWKKSGKPSDMEICLFLQVPICLIRCQDIFINSGHILGTSTSIGAPSQRHLDFWWFWRTIFDKVHIPETGKLW